MAVLVLDLPVLAVDVELGTLVLADLAPGINGIPLLVEVSAATGCAVFLNISTTIGVRDYMMGSWFLWHGRLLSTVKITLRNLE